MSQQGHDEPDLSGYKGPVAWMAQNTVAANLLMLVLIVGGLVMAGRIKQEVFPEFELDIVNITVPYPGASPDEVEQGVLLVIEEAVRGIDGVKKVTATAREGAGSVQVELLLGSDPDKVLQDVKNAIDRVTSFPQDSERPVVSLIDNQNEVISLVIYGDLDEQTLRSLAEQTRDKLLQRPDITQVELAPDRPLEISIEVPQEKLRAYNLSLQQIAARVSAASVEIPGGELETPGGEILVRTDERRDLAEDFAETRILSRANGTDLRLGDIAELKDGFADNDVAAFYNGKPAMRVRVFRVGTQTPITVADAVKEFIDEEASSLPPGVGFAVWNDRSEIFRDRVNLLLRNAFMGLILVLFVLGLFLQFGLAFWVTMGIPISFLGAMLLMPTIGVSINMISLFAFIIALGIVVDDAIVVGENIFTMRQQGISTAEAAIKAAQEVAAPVTFSVLTTVVAFTPMFFVPGAFGKVFAVIPAIVVSVLLLSLVESLFVLPAHLAHGGNEETGVLGFINRQQKRFSDGLEAFIRNLYQPVARVAVQHRYLSLAIGIAMLIATLGLIAGGRVQFSFFPKVDGDIITASVRLPVGSPAADSERLRARLQKTARQVIDANGGMDIVRGQLTQMGQGIRGGGPNPASGANGSHVIDMAIFLVPTDQRELNASQFAKAWRETFGEVAGVDSLSFRYNIGPSGGLPIDIQLSHRDTRVLEAAASRLAGALRDYGGVTDIEDGFADGKTQFEFKLKPEARTLGLTEQDLGRQLRAAFFGAEAVRQQRGRNELRVFVRLPKETRNSEQILDELLIRTPQGGEVPLRMAAEMVRSQAPTEIKRVNGRRVVNVTADIEEGAANANEVIASVGKTVIPALQADFRGLSYSLEGEQSEQSDTLGSLRSGGLIALLGIFALLAIPFRSYIQPLIIMSAIPFGLVGAVFGHVIMDMELSLLSVMGIVALTGIVVNDSLVLIVFINKLRDEGVPIETAVVRGGMERFRPILLTSLTTSLGLAPMVLETSVQARFLVPMAISLAYGVIFATFVILLLVPCLYLMIEDFQSLASILTGRRRTSSSTAAQDARLD